MTLPAEPPIAAFVRFKAWVRRRRWLYRLAACPCPAPYWDRRVAATLRELGRDARVADLGAGSRKRLPHVWNVELTAAPPTDVVADVHELPFDDASLDGVVAEALLEHVRDPVAVVREVARVLRPGGIVCAASPFLQPYHPSPTDYHRWTLDGFRALFDGFDCVAAGNCVGPTAALHWVFREWVGVVLSFGSLWAAKGVAWLIGWVTAPLLWLDWALLLRADSHRVASAVYFIGRKPTR